MRAKAWLFLGIFILLASCQPAEVPTPQATLQPLRVQLTSLLEPSWLPKLHTCSEYLTQSNLVIEVRSASEFNLPSADLMVRTSADLETEQASTYLGTERLALVVNTENPFNALSQEEAGAIFARTYAQWKEVPSLAALPQGFDQPIKPIFLVDPELNAFFSAIFPGLELTPATDEQAYAIEMAQQLIAETPGAIGLLPASALTPTLKQVQILAPDGKAIIWQLHVLGLTPVEPTGDVLQMLLCLQNSSQP